MSAESIARALDGHRVGSNWMARCPAHDDRTPSLSICENGDRVLVHCFAGCDQSAVIAALRHQGVWSGESIHEERSATPSTRTEPSSRNEERTESARRLWESSRPGVGTLVQVYLSSRDIVLPPPEGLRYRENLNHKPSGTCLPCMVAAVIGPGHGLVAVHRTFLRRDGSGKADVEPAKMILGPSRGGGVKLTPRQDGRPIIVAEGIESALSALAIIDPSASAIAALSTSGLRSLELPPEAREIIIGADRDQAGEVAAEVAAERWRSEGRRVRIAYPREGFKDFNEVLKARNASIESRAKNRP